MSEPEPPSPLSREGLVYWFKADAGVKVADGRVQSWADQSGNGQDAWQDTPSERPTLTTSELVPYPVVVFDGETAFRLPEVDAPFDAGVTFFAVAGRSADSSCAAFVELSRGLELDDLHFGYAADTLHYEVGDSYFNSDASVFDLNELRQVTIQHSGDASGAVAQMSASGAVVGAKSTPLPARVARAQNFMGNSQYVGCTKLMGGIGELILYARALDRSEQKAVEKYLRDKWRL